MNADPRIVSYLTLRKAVGYLGIALPVVLAVGNWLFFSGRMQPSVSDYAYTGMRGVLEGGLCVIGAFMLVHCGHDRWETLLARTAGLGAIGLALFPSPPKRPSLLATVDAYGHFVSGTVLFTSLIVTLVWAFRRGGGQDRVRAGMTRLRSRIYLVCGVVMAVTLSLAGLAQLRFAVALTPLHPVFWMESAAIVAFGVSWLVRGQAVASQLQPQLQLTRRDGAAGRLA